MGSMLSHIDKLTEEQTGELGKQRGNNGLTCVSMQNGRVLLQSMWLLTNCFNTTLEISGNITVEGGAHIISDLLLLFVMQKDYT